MKITRIKEKNRLHTFKDSTRYLVLRTIGVYHQHHMCGALARYVRSISTTAKACKLSAIMFIIMNIE